MEESAYTLEPGIYTDGEEVYWLKENSFITFHDLKKYELLHVQAPQFMGPRLIGHDPKNTLFQRKVSQLVQRLESDDEELVKSWFKVKFLEQQDHINN